MKITNFKSWMIIAIFIASMISMPVMGFAQDEEETAEEENQQGIFENYRGGFGGVFSENLGYGGNIIGDLFEMLLLEGMDLEDTEMVESTYVLSATKQEEYSGVYDFEEQGDTREIHYLPFVDEWNWTADYSFPDLPIDGVNDYFWDNNTYGNAYCEVIKSGSFNYTLTVGAALTLIIWDHDKSFIDAAIKVLDWAKDFREAEEKDDITPELYAKGAEVLVWLLTNINDIFTGDELFVFNPIVWQKLTIDPNPSFSITKTWKCTTTDFIIDNDDEDIKTTYNALYNNTIMEDEYNGTGLQPQGWKFLANAYQDYYMQWLLDPQIDPQDLVQTTWTQFSFDLLQLWMKKFYMEIDVGELTKGEDANMADVFAGCEIDFFLFTHHLAGAFLYDDYDNNTIPSVEYVPVKDKYTGEDMVSNGTVVMVPISNEITHQLTLTRVGNFAFSKPKIDDDDHINWGLTLQNANISAVPVGVDLNAFLNATEEELRYIQFGLSFETDIEGPDKEGEYQAEGHVKLNHNFAPWNDKLTGKPHTNVNITGLDMCILYVSSILHFELDLDNEKDDPDDPETEDYDTTTQTLKVGDYISGDSKDKLDFVDIAGPNYLIGNDTNLDGSPDEYYSRQATTVVANIGSYNAMHEEHENYEGDEDTAEDDFSSDLSVAVTWDFMFYGVCYPDFNGTGMGIWHDPTFSVYIVFTPESAGFWALILLIAGVGLAGVACILIKRRKDKKF